MGRLPKRYRQFMQDYPEVGMAYEAFGEAVGKSGPIDEKTRSMIKLATSIGARMEGAAKSHTHKALLSGVTPDEIRHIAILSAPTIGFPNMMAGLSWVNEIIEESKND